MRTILGSKSYPVAERSRHNTQHETQNLIRASIRRINVVIDLEDILAPELSLPDFVAINGKKPEGSRYRIVQLEVVTCPDDNQPILVSECARNPRFLRRAGDFAYFRRD